MRCVSCTADIPPEWKNAIASNKCPGCGECLMREEDKTLLDEIADAFQKMPNDPQGITGWLLSHYKIQKIGDGKPVERFHVKSSEAVGGAQLKHAPNPADEFLKRKAGNSGFDKVQATSAKMQAAAARNDKMAVLAAAVRQAQDSDDIYGVPPVQEPEEVDGETMQEDLAEYQKMVRAGVDPFKGSAAAAAAAGGLINPNAKPLSQDELATVYNIASGVDREEIALASTDEGRIELTKRRLAQLKKQDLFEGGSIGVISRK